MGKTRICRKCGEIWQVSAKHRGGIHYVCPNCTFGYKTPWNRDRYYTYVAGGKG